MYDSLPRNKHQLTLVSLVRLHTSLSLQFDISAKFLDVDFVPEHAQLQAGQVLWATCSCRLDPAKDSSAAGCKGAGSKHSSNRLAMSKECRPASHNMGVTKTIALADIRQAAMITPDLGTSSHTLVLVVRQHQPSVGSACIMGLAHVLSLTLQ